VSTSRNRAAFQPYGYQTHASQSGSSKSSRLGRDYLTVELSGVEVGSEAAREAHYSIQETLEAAGVKFPDHDTVKQAS
jgi:hypothetical protein